MGQRKCRGERSSCLLGSRRDGRDKRESFHVNSNNHEMLATRQVEEVNHRKLWNTRRETNGLGICSLFGSQVAGSSVDLPNDDSPEPDDEEVV